MRGGRQSADVDALAPGAHVPQGQKAGAKHGVDDWAAYFLNWLVLALLTFVGGVTAVALVLTLPLVLVYLVLCYTDETGPIRIATPQRTRLPA
jgi:hypothetical protein